MRQGREIREEVERRMGGRFSDPDRVAVDGVIDDVISEAARKQTVDAILLLLRADRLRRYTIQAMGGFQAEVASWFEVIHCRTGDEHARVDITPDGQAFINFVAAAGRDALTPSLLEGSADHDER